MNTFYRNFIVVLALLLTPGAYLFAQLSPNTISYKVTYDFATQKYTVYVVPEYSVPNSTNPALTERGATAQVTIAVPKDFLISNIVNIKGAWEQFPLKLGPGQPNQDWSAYSLDPNTNYYAIGMSPGNTDYGTFTSGVEVALFTFTGNGCFGSIRVIEPDEPFIAAADRLGLNVPNNFNSRSGGLLEQFRAVVGLPACCTASSTVGIATNPANAQICSGSSATFSVVGTGQGLTYRWQVNAGAGFVNLTNDAVYAGVSLANLTLSSPSSALNSNQYRCIVSNQCGTSSATSTGATLNIIPQTVSYTSPISINLGVKQAVSQITATNKILQPNGKAEYQAGNFISLQPGFEVEQGAIFKALIQNLCPSF